MRKPDKKAFLDFLDMLDEEAEYFTFQTFPDSKKPSAKELKALTRVLHGTGGDVYEVLADLNNSGAGIFVSVNQTDRMGRKASNIERVRALWIDEDGPLKKPIDFDPHIVVETSPGKKHHYLLVEGLEKEDFPRYQNHLVTEYGSDPSAKDVARVLRVPGFFHLKNPESPHLVRVLEQSSAIPIDCNRLEKLFRKNIEVQSEVGNSADDGGLLNLVKDSARLTPKQLAAVFEIDPDPRNNWLEVGMAIHQATDGGKTGLAQWNAWAAASEKFELEQSRKTWESFGKYAGKELTFGSIFHKLQSRLNSAHRESEQSAIFGFRTADDLLTNLAPTNWLVDGILISGALTMLFGPSGSYKTFLALHLLLCIATGKPFFGHEVRQGPTAMIIGEGQQNFAKRVKAWMLYHGVTSLPNFYISTAPAQFMVEESADIVQGSLKNIPDLQAVAVDTLNRNFGPGDENKTSDMTTFVRNIDASIGREVARIVVHHTGTQNTDRAMGSIVFRNSADSVFRLRNEEGSLSLACLKQKDAQAFPDKKLVTRTVPMTILGEAESSVVLEEDLFLGEEKRTREEALMDLIVGGDGLTIKEIRDNFEDLGYSSPNTLSAVVSRLVKKGVLKKEKDLIVLKNA